MSIYVFIVNKEREQEATLHQHQPMPATLFMTKMHSGVEQVFQGE